MPRYHKLGKIPHKDILHSKNQMVDITMKNYLALMDLMGCQPCFITYTDQLSYGYTWVIFVELKLQ